MEETEKYNREKSKIPPASGYQHPEAEGHRKEAANRANTLSLLGVCLTDILGVFTISRNKQMDTCRDKEKAWKPCLRFKVFSL